MDMITLLGYITSFGLYLGKASSKLVVVGSKDLHALSKLVSNSLTPDDKTGCSTNCRSFWGSWPFKPFKNRIKAGSGLIKSPLFKNLNLK